MGSAFLVQKVGTALFSKGRRELLALLFTHPERTFYLRQIVRVLGIGQGAAQRELSRLSEAAVITRTRVGSQIHYQANRRSPVFTELKSLMVKTAGVAEVLRDSLAMIAEQIDAAFIFGSFARAEDRANSDVDVMVVGSVSFGDVVTALQPAQKRIGREVNPAVFSAEEYRTKTRSKDRFLGSVLNSPRIFLIGGENELKRLG
jgi:predicted nucleotidyltransferase